MAKDGVIGAIHPHDIGGFRRWASIRPIAQRRGKDRDRRQLRLHHPRRTERATEIQGRRSCRQGDDDRVAAAEPRSSARAFRRSALRPHAARASRRPRLAVEPRPEPRASGQGDDARLGLLPLRASARRPRRLGREEKGIRRRHARPYERIHREPDAGQHPGASRRHAARHGAHLVELPPRRYPRHRAQRLPVRRASPDAGARQLHGARGRAALSRRAIPASGRRRDSAPAAPPRSRCSTICGSISTRSRRGKSFRRPRESGDPGPTHVACPGFLLSQE